MIRVPEIRLLTKKDLIKKSDLGFALPLSEAKLNWHLGNPRAGQNDILLAIAVLDNEVVGHIHLVPDFIRTHEGPKKFFWMLVWKMHPKFENTVVATYLYSETLKATQNSVLIRSYAQSANQFYKKLPFVHFFKRKRHTFFLGINATLVQQKVTFAKRMPAPLALIERTSQRLWNTLNRPKLKKMLKGITVKSVDALNEDVCHFILEHCKSDAVPKDRGYLNWHLQLDSTWHLPAGKSVPQGCQSYALSKNKTIFGFLTLTISGKEAHVKYFLAAKKDYPSMAALAIDQALRLRCTHINVDNQGFMDAVNSTVKPYYRHAQVKHALYHKSQADVMTITMLKDQDGHYI